MTEARQITREPTIAEIKSLLYQRENKDDSMRVAFATIALTSFILGCAGTTIAILWAGIKYAPYPPVFKITFLIPVFGGLGICGIASLCSAVYFKYSSVQRKKLEALRKKKEIEIAQSKNFQGEDIFSSTMVCPLELNNTRRKPFKS